MSVNSRLASCHADKTQQAGAEEPEGWGDGDDIARLHSPRVVGKRPRIDTYQFTQ